MTGKFTLTEDGLVIAVRNIPNVVESVGDRKGLLFKPIFDHEGVK